MPEGGLLMPLLPPGNTGYGAELQFDLVGTRQGEGNQCVRYQVRIMPALAKFTSCFSPNCQ